MTKFSHWLKAFDPGWIRLEQVVKAGLAIVTAMAAMLVVMLSIAPKLDIAPVIFAFFVAFMSFMLVNEVQPRERQRTLLMAALLFIVGPLVVSLVQASPLAVSVILLAVMFLSFYVRRYGQRAAELGIAATLAIYIPWLFGAKTDNAVWFAAGAIIGIASAFFWQFIVKPFNPRRYLRRGVRAFDESAADSLAAIMQQLASPTGHPPSRAGTGPPDETQAALKRVHTSRRVIETQLAGLAGAPDWTRESLGQLRMQLFDAEQGLERMADGAAVLAEHRSQIPEPLRTSVDQALAALKGTLASAGSAETMAALKQANTQLANEARAAVPAREGGRPVGDDTSTWKPALVALGIGGARVAQSVQGVRALATQPHPAAAASSPPAPATKQQPGGLHPTTRLGIQAVVACAAAMIVAAVFNLDRPYWAFWTAYIVVAGPVGESLQKIINRVIGVALGSAFGTLLVLALPNSLLILLPLQILAMMMALYTRVINYAWTVFWITTFVALLYRVEGVPPATLLIERPLNSLIGASIAALVVWYVLPIRERDKFRKALAGYLTATDAYLGALAGSLKQAVAPAAAGAAAMQVSGTYEAVAQTFPAMALEYSPLSQAQSPVTIQSTIVNSLRADVDHFAEFVTDGASDISVKQASLIQTLQAMTHDNVESLKHVLDRQPAQPFRSLAEYADQLDVVGFHDSGAGDADAQPDVGLRAIAYLSRINQSIIELGVDRVG